MPNNKEIRFRKLVDASGKPEIVSLWTDLKRDRRFMRAIKERRVLTVIQEPRTHKKQFGKLGFHQDPHASYLVFPKPLPVDAESRVVGITYDLVLETRVADPFTKTALIPPRPKLKVKRKGRSFHVIVQRTAAIETSIEVEARTALEAEQKALAKVRTQPFDGSKAIIKNQVRTRD